MIHEMRRLSLIAAAAILLWGCGKDSGGDPAGGGGEEVPVLDKIANQSLTYESRDYEVELSRDVSGVATATIHDYNSDFIREIKIVKSGNVSKLTYWVEKNLNTDRGYRSGQIDITSGGKSIGTVRVYQARNHYCPTTLQWCTDKATTYKDKALADVYGREATQIIYNLEKTTGGKDNYRNYPAFAYCIEMNPDPERNMEWYLPRRMGVYMEKKGWDIFGFRKFWSSYDVGLYSEVDYFTENKYQTQYINTDKSNYNYVYAVREEGY